jgi:hypothetical protein
MGGRMSEDKRIAELREQLFAAQAEHRKAQASLRRAHEIFKDAPPVDGTHALKLALGQQYRAIQRVAEMLNKFGDGLQQKEKDG